MKGHENFIWPQICLFKQSAAALKKKKHFLCYYCFLLLFFFFFFFSHTASWILKLIFQWKPFQHESPPVWVGTSTTGRKAEAYYTAGGSPSPAMEGPTALVEWNWGQYSTGPVLTGSRVAPALILGTSLRLWAQLDRAHGQARQGILELEPSNAGAFMGQKVMKTRLAQESGPGQVGQPQGTATGLSEPSNTPSTWLKG